MRIPTIRLIVTRILFLLLTDIVITVHCFEKTVGFISGSKSTTNSDHYPNVLSKINNLISFIKMFPLLRTNLTLSLTRRYISTTAKKMVDASTYYISCNGITQKKVSNLLEEFVDNLINMRGKCMDVGCGPGDVTKNVLLPALHQNAVVIGTDVSKNMIEYAKEKYSIKEQLEFEVLDIQTKELPKKYVSEFDHIFSFYALHWCYDIRQALENIYHMLRPNGTILVLLVAYHDVFEVLKNMAQDIRFASYIPDVRKYISPYHDSVNPRKELKELFQELGFTVNHCSLRDNFFSDENEMEWNLDQYMVCVLSILDFIDEMPSDLKEEFKKDFTRQFKERKINYKRSESQKFNILDLSNVLIAFAQKV